MLVAFVWQESSNPEVFNRWDDGLREAVRIVENKHTVTYHEPWDDVSHADVILYWEAPCTARGKNAEHYNKIRSSPQKKIMLFAGGPVELDTCVGFDYFLVESEINEKEFEALGLPWRRAFGVNDKILQPQKQVKKHDAFFQATFAGWKRHELFAEAMGSRGTLAGRVQEGDRNGYNRAVELQCNILPALSMEDVGKELNKSVCCLNTSEFWGGGQRTTLEAMACNCPPIVMSDSPKNVEYVEESGYGIVVPPKAEEIRKAVDEIRTWNEEKRSQGRKYIESKWTGKHYADAILETIDEVCSQ